ncbi:MAG: sulfite exporter TauE/SafE family protein, partial [Candidatus Fermentibacteraceae bacterium]|nr:sulfite exporter TauE/SafE family protein [Candidatus Fermentibacteraceae bacterium]
MGRGGCGRRRGIPEDRLCAQLDGGSGLSDPLRSIFLNGRDDIRQALRDTHPYPRHLFRSSRRIHTLPSQTAPGHRHGRHGGSVRLSDATRGIRIRTLQVLCLRPRQGSGREQRLNIALIAAILLSGACLQGLTGFGYSLFSLPLLVLLMPVQQAVPMLSMTSIFLNVVVFIRARRNLDLRRIVPLLAAGVAGLPAGVWILKTADQSLLKIAIGGIVAVSSLMFISGFRIKVAREKPAMVPVGLLSGVLSGATTLSGPPVILFFVNQDVPKHQFRASLSAYFLLLNLVAVPAFAAGGLLT